MNHEWTQRGRVATKGARTLVRSTPRIRRLDKMIQRRPTAERCGGINSALRKSYDLSECGRPGRSQLRREWGSRSCRSPSAVQCCFARGRAHSVRFRLRGTESVRGSPIQLYLFSVVCALSFSLSVFAKDVEEKQTIQKTFVFDDSAGARKIEVDNLGAARHHPDQQRDSLLR